MLVVRFVADKIAPTDSGIGLQLLARCRELTVPRIDGDLTSSALYAFVAAALAVAADAFDVSEVLKPEGKKQLVVGTSAWAAPIHNSQRLIISGNCVYNCPPYLVRNCDWHKVCSPYEASLNDGLHFLCQQHSNGRRSGGLHADTVRRRH